VTVVATGLLVHRALAAAGQLEAEGIHLEVIGPRTLVPPDKATNLAAVRKTSRALVVTEEVRMASCGARIAAMIREEAFDYLDTPVAKSGKLDLPIPFPPQAQEFVSPCTADIIGAAKSLMA
jgi:pyruvate dehydrogenase E1 component beta subunit